MCIGAEGVALEDRVCVCAVLLGICGSLGVQEGVSGVLGWRGVSAYEDQSLDPPCPACLCRPLLSLLPTSTPSQLAPPPPWQCSRHSRWAAAQRARTAGWFPCGAPPGPAMQPTVLLALQQQPRTPIPVPLPTRCLLTHVNIS